MAAIIVPGTLLLLPGTLEHKSHLLLHGLCAQRPSHSFLLGGQMLPFDARMTGIYGGFSVAALYLLARGRFRALATPPAGVVLLLGMFVGLLVVDGFNSLLLDLRLWHPYVPRNDFRLVTGLLTGVALAGVVAYLVSITLWQTGRGTLAAVRDAREVGLLAALQAPFVLAVLVGPGWLYPIVTLALVASALLVCGLLALVIVVLIRRQDGILTTWQDATGSISLALLLAVCSVGGLAAGRFWLEHLSGTAQML